MRSKLGFIEELNYPESLDFHKLLAQKTPETQQTQRTLPCLEGGPP
jgi:hypothetical protein